MVQIYCGGRDESNQIKIRKYNITDAKKRSSALCLGCGSEGGQHEIALHATSRYQCITSVRLSCEKGQPSQWGKPCEFTPGFINNAAGE